MWLWLCSLALADSPITSTEFYPTYLELPQVREARENGGVLTPELAKWLSKGKGHYGERAAVVNALSWEFEGKKNAELYLDFLAQRYRKTPDELIVGGPPLKPHETFVLGYLLVMDDYFTPERAIPVLEIAATAAPDSFTVAAVLALAKGQAVMERDWCEVWRAYEPIVNDTERDRDLKPEAEAIVTDYVRLYMPECFGRPALGAPAEAGPGAAAPTAPPPRGAPRPR